ncbi:N(6)-adenosine-methyltransferase subunit METTL3 [Scyliorhinus torazame]|uniref:N(6)-adenosine-methyltransferase subunit METTL3 n=1 Tax=Scyliorhinus torazame TaxID=75743 RepID=UPI003B58D7A7
MSDTWSSIQAHKKQLDSLRERIQRRRREPGPGGGGGGGQSEGALSPTLRCDSPVPAVHTPPPRPLAQEHDGKTHPQLEKKILEYLSDPSLLLPTDSLAILNTLLMLECPVSQCSVESLLQKFSAQELIEIRGGLSLDGRPTCVTFADHCKLSAMVVVAPQDSRGAAEAPAAGLKRRADQEAPGAAVLPEKKVSEAAKKSKKVASEMDLEIESLLNQQSTKERENKKMNQEILELLNTSTAKEQSIVEKFRSRGRAQVQEFCDHGTKLECMAAHDLERPCRKLHFRSVVG